MVNKREILKIIGLLILAWLFFDFFKSIIRGPEKVIIYKSNIPDPDPNKVPFKFDFYTGKWVYKDTNIEVIDRAKGNQGVTRKQREAEIQEYLEKRIDGYKEKTYWGQEWDANNWDDDDKEDDWDDMRKK
jgi:hypothetical protein